MTERAARKGAAGAIDRFFERELMPLASELKAKGVAFLDVAPAPQAPSYYVDRTPPAMTPAAFEWGGADSQEQLEAALVEMWSKPAWRPLAALAPSTAALARALYSVEDQPAEVSQFVYVMY